MLTYVGIQEIHHTSHLLSGQPCFHCLFCYLSVYFNAHHNCRADCIHIQEPLYFHLQ